MVLLTGSVFKYPHGLHWNTFKFSAKARLIVCRRVIGRPQAAQMTSFVELGSLLIAPSMGVRAGGRLDADQPTSVSRIGGRGSAMAPAYLDTQRRRTYASPLRSFL